MSLLDELMKVHRSRNSLKDDLTFKFERDKKSINQDFSVRIDTLIYPILNGESSGDDILDTLIKWHQKIPRLNLVKLCYRVNNFRNGLRNFKGRYIVKEEIPETSYTLGRISLDEVLLTNSGTIFINTDNIYARAWYDNPVKVKTSLYRTNLPIELENIDSYNPTKDGKDVPYLIWESLINRLNRG